MIKSIVLLASNNNSHYYGGITLTDMCTKYRDRDEEEEFGASQTAKKRQRLAYYHSALMTTNSNSTNTTAESSSDSDSMDWGLESTVGTEPIMMLNQDFSSQASVQVYMATLFPLRHFVANLDSTTEKLVLKCKYCQKFEHLPGHSQPLEIPLRNERDIQSLYNPELNLELNSHLGFCLNCSDHNVRSWGQAFFQLLKHPSSVREEHEYFWALSRSLYQQARQKQQQQQPWAGLGDCMTRDCCMTREQVDLFDTQIEKIESRRQVANFPCGHACF